MANATTAGGSRPQQLLSVWAGTSFILGVVIGIGVFRTPSDVASSVDSEAMFIAVWLLGGLIMLVGAFCYAELGSAHPDAGGEYHYLSRAFGRPIGKFQAIRHKFAEMATKTEASKQFTYATAWRFATTSAGASEPAIMLSRVPSFDHGTMRRSRRRSVRR